MRMEPKPSKKNLTHEECFLPEAGSTFYQGEKERWHGGFLEEEGRRRAEKLRQREEQLARKREALERRDRERRQQEERRYQEEQRRVEALQRGCHSNKSGVPFDILTLEARPTPEAAALQHQEVLKQQRMQQRSQRLWERNNTATHNIINGAPLWPFPDAGAHRPTA